MKHATFYEMTFAALSKRAAEIKTMGTVSECLGGDDQREVQVFLDHDQSSHGYGDDHVYRPEGKEVIGIAFCDLDDPYAAIEILDRNQAVDLFGWRWIADREEMK